MQVKVIGIGNRFRRDDGVGLEVARRIKERAPESVEVIELYGEGAELIEAFDGADAVILVDAARAGSGPGAHVQLDPALETIPSDYFSYSTHAFSLAEAVELARVLDQLPDEVRIHAIVGADFGVGEGLSKDVESAIPAVVDCILNQINQLSYDHA
jgi:hydrogenase maturation protease